MTKEDILCALKTKKIFYVDPMVDDAETDISLASLLGKGIIESCYDQCPEFMNSSYAFVMAGTKVFVKRVGNTSFLKVFPKRNKPNTNSA